ncbi:Membrane protein involved in the export of O-antigen, teichoic acid lipoteichoic acid [Paraburkholderia piptadeniae]|uniref:Membrane protein involved in the export of O-antigen, teichoic acid lipoteichoic acid n=1 Tax=Paraburkholderia piptadeniae TaxID=1701573 RepID=A0A1N7RQ62_9BURK|nr:oligosaccharide flippase family protein [Paraburkholderia piptadeniae]SIT37265.1 Membrane protein involved in the export of O-antigen, teichoic acid lipoteichoic acid [Paraburkholderia piptadeniae]
MDGKKSANVIAFVYGGYLMRYVYLIIVVPFYGRVLGVAEYGRVLAAMSLMNVIWMLVSYGFTFVGMREVSKAQDTNECNAIYSLHTSARLVLAVLGGAVGLIATMCSPALSERPLIGVLATLLGIVSALNLGWLYQGRQHFRTPIMIEVFGFALSLALVLSLVKGPADSIWVVASLFIAGIASAAISYGLATFQLGRPRLSLSGIVPLIKNSTMLFCYSSGSVVLTASSTYLLTLLSTPEQVGYFGAAERFATIALALMGPAGQVFIPTISRQLAQGDKAGAHATTRRGAMLLLGYGLLVFCGALALSPFVLPLILGHAFTPSARVLQCFAWMFPFAAFNEFAAFYVFVPRRKDRVLAIAGAAAGIANLGSALWLAPRFGAEGMAFARVIGELSLSVMLLTIMVRLQLVTLLPGAGRAMELMARMAWAKPHAGTGKDE